MRVSLVLSGIEEQREDYAVAIFQDLIQRKFKTNYETSFESVHRIGKWNKINYRSRNRLECVDCSENLLRLCLLLQYYKKLSNDLRAIFTKLRT